MVTQGCTGIPQIHKLEQVCDDDGFQSLSPLVPTPTAPMAMLMGTATSATTVGETGGSDSGGSSTHYGDPQKNGGCSGGEQIFKDIGDSDGGKIEGDVCAPPCYSNGSCPKDRPKDTTAVPQCLLTDEKSGKNYCALLCDPYGKKPLNCGKDAKCRPVKGQLIGICTYDLNKNNEEEEEEQVGNRNTEAW